MKVTKNVLKSDLKVPETDLKSPFKRQKVLETDDTSFWKELKSSLKCLKSDSVKKFLKRAKNVPKAI